MLKNHKSIDWPVQRIRSHQIRELVDWVRAWSAFHAHPPLQRGPEQMDYLIICLDWSLIFPERLIWCSKDTSDFKENTETHRNFASFLGDTNTICFLAKPIFVCNGFQIWKPIDGTLRRSADSSIVAALISCKLTMKMTAWHCSLISDLCSL